MKWLSLVSTLWQKIQFFFYRKAVNDDVDKLATSQSDEEDAHDLQELQDDTYGKANQDPTEKAPASAPPPPPSVPFSQ